MRPPVRSRFRPLAAVLFAAALTPAPHAAAQAPPLEAWLAYPYPADLSAGGSRIAWTFNERGLRNVWTAAAPDFTPRRVTDFGRDDGQAISALTVSPDGRWAVFVRGGDFGSNWDDALPVNPIGDPELPETQLWRVALDGSAAPAPIGAGESPAISPRGDVVAFVRNRQLWTAPLDGSAPPRRLITARGSNGSPTWSPDGSQLAFVSGRSDHAFIGIYRDSVTPIRWIAPSTSRDMMPRWSPDGRRLVFVRRPGSGGAPDSLLARRHQPWALMVADVAAGTARERWRAPATLEGSVPTTHGGVNLHWAAGDRLTYLSYEDGWPHLYALGADDGAPVRLTTGDYMVEHVRLSPDGRTLVASANTGPAADDLHRRHVLVVPVDGSGARVLTPGEGTEWTPVVLGDGATVAYLGATRTRPPLPVVQPLAGGAPRVLAEARVPADWPGDRFVQPRAVSFRAADGTLVHGQLFRRDDVAGPQPAVVYVHGGPPRQMLLGWHYSDYYANAFALNQYLANRGFAVLSVNYRLGIGYGHAFHQPPAAGRAGAAEFRDVEAGAEWLRTQPYVDPSRIGIYGGSYGGFLTAMALAKRSDLFAVGVDVHGVHDWTTERARGMLERDRYEQAPDLEAALRTAWESSPVAHVAGWRSPVLVIHGDDDRNVRFSQTVDLVQRLRAQGVPHEELVIPDDTHHFMRWAHQRDVNAAIAAFLARHLRPPASRASR